MMTCRSDAAEVVRDTLSMEQIVRFYGYEPTRAGFICCPFHNEKTPSLKLYGKRFYCFGCHRGGSGIDFVMELFGLDFRNALMRLDADFCLGLTGAKPDRAAIQERKRRQIRTRAQKDAACREYDRMIREFRTCNEIIRTQQPKDIGEMSDEFVYAMKRLPELEYWFDAHDAPRRP